MIMNGKVAATVSALLLASGSASSRMPAPQPGHAPEALPEADVPLGTGPYPASMLVDPALPGHTMYRPADLARVPGKLPVLVWGNGGCADAGNSVRGYLSEIASYGYIVVAAGKVQPNARWLQLPRPFLPSSDGVVRGPDDTPRQLPPPATHTSALIAAIDWVTKEAGRTTGDLAGRIDASHIAVAGHSCGGVQAIEASADPRVTTTMVMNSGLLPGGTSMAGGQLLTKADLLKLHAPVAYISGDQQDVAFSNAQDDFGRLTHVPVFRGWERGIPHGGTYQLPNGGEYAGVAIAWLNWQLKGDARAARMFQGKDCGLCVNPRWVVSSKRM